MYIKKYTPPIFTSTHSSQILNFEKKKKLIKIWSSKRKILLKSPSIARSISNLAMYYPSYLNLKRGYKKW